MIGYKFTKTDCCYSSQIYRYTKASSTSVCKKGSSMIMTMKSSKVKKIVVGVDNDSVYAEQATTSSDILNLDSLSVGRYM